MIDAPATRPYERVREALAAQRCVVLDGGLGTNLISASGARPEVDEELWGLRAVAGDPEGVQEIHRQYAAAGCDVISTATWALRRLCASTRRDAFSPISPRCIGWISRARP